ncbi:MAG: flavin reductase family protein [Rhodospirillales bacterium]|nr:flavin reductase family protein [Rhodospirillales bacterium]
MFIDPAVSLPPPPLAHSPFKALVVPRPIAWVSTVSRAGVINVAPYSFFNAISEDPCCVMFAAGGNHVDGGIKDSQKNAEETGEFVVNLVSHPLRESMNRTSANVGRAVSEMTLAGLAAAPSVKVKPPRIADSPASLECRWLQTIPVPHPRAKDRHVMVIGEVVGIYIRDDMIVDGRVDMTRLQPVARLGYNDYTTVTDVFSMIRPG